MDGANIKIPERLTRPPEQEAPFIIDILETAFDTFARTFTEATRSDVMSAKEEDGKELVSRLLRSEQNSLSEFKFELFELAYRLATKNGFDIKPFLAQIDFSALTTSQKHEMSSALSLSDIHYPEIWNSLFSSDILTARDLYQRDLARPFAIHRLYSSKTSGMKTFFEYMKMAVKDYTRKLIIIKVC